MARLKGFILCFCCIFLCLKANAVIGGDTTSCPGDINTCLRVYKNCKSCVSQITNGKTCYKCSAYYSRECSVNGVEYKVSGICGTQKRECCGTGDTAWSEWGKACPTENHDNQCWNGSTWLDKPSTTCSVKNGTCSLRYTCIENVGWRPSRSIVCNSGYIRYLEKCVKYQFVLAGDNDKGDSIGPCPDDYNCSSALLDRTCIRKVTTTIICPPHTPGTVYNCVNGAQTTSFYTYVCKAVE